MKPHLAIWLTGTLLGATVLLVSLPLAIYGVPRGHDWSHELVRVAQIQAAFEDGQLPPAWAPDLYHGWGSPIFLFYAPLFATLASLAAGLLGSVDRAIVGLSKLFAAHRSWLSDLEVNTLMVREEGRGALAVDVRAIKS